MTARQAIPPDLDEIIGTLLMDYLDPDIADLVDFAQEHADCEDLDGQQISDAAFHVKVLLGQLAERLRDAVEGAE